MPYYYKAKQGKKELFNTINTYFIYYYYQIYTGNIIIIIYYLMSNLDPYQAYTDYSLYTYKEKTLFKKTP